MKKKSPLIFIFLLLIIPSILFSGEAVSVYKEGDRWAFKVDGKPFWVKGVGLISSENNQLSKNEKGIDYLRMANEMGANTIRTWGDVPSSVVDKANEHKLKVCVGLWLNPVRPESKVSYRNEYDRWQVENKILSYVKKMKDRPAVLCWILGNEIFNYPMNWEEEERLGNLYRNLVTKIHEIDPQHPIVYAAATEKDLEKIKKYGSELDIIGLNVYEPLQPLLDWMGANEPNKPVLVTEFGPTGPWDQPLDGNGLPWDESDGVKARDYADRFDEIQKSNLCLGGVAFVLGPQRNQGSLTWFNVNFRELRRETFWTLFQIYTQQEPPNHAPKISQFELVTPEGLKPGQEVHTNLKVIDPDNDALTYEFFMSDTIEDSVMLVPPKLYPVPSSQSADGTFVLRLPQKKGPFRLYVSVSDSHQNTAIENISIAISR